MNELLDQLELPRPTPSELPFYALLRRLMKGEVRAITGHSIRWDNRFYHCEGLTSVQGLDVIIRFLPRVHDRIWIYDQHDQPLGVGYCMAEMPIDERATFERIVVNSRDTRLKVARKFVDSELAAIAANRPVTTLDHPDAHQELDLTDDSSQFGADAESLAFPIAKVGRVK